MFREKVDAYKRISFIFLGVTGVILFFVWFLTYIHSSSTSADPFVSWTVNNHLIITVILMVISVIFGYTLSAITFTELKKSRKGAKKLLDILFVFLTNEERSILKYLVDHKGNASQADIARLPDMNRVKAFRSLQKMKENNLIEIQAHGKVRYVKLKENFYEILQM